MCFALLVLLLWHQMEVSGKDMFGSFYSINLCVVHTESKDVTQLLKLLQVNFKQQEYGEKAVETSAHHWGFFRNLSWCLQQFCFPLHIVQHIGPDCPAAVHFRLATHRIHLFCCLLLLQASIAAQKIRKAFFLDQTSKKNLFYHFFVMCMHITAISVGGKNILN